MAAFVTIYDPLRLSSDRAAVGGAGLNYADNRTVWHPLSEIEFSTESSIGLPDESGTIEGAQWYGDAGPNTLPAAEQEARKFCVKGALGFEFVGRTLIVRLNTDYGWFTGAQVYVDDVPPSTLGLLVATDTLSCHAADHGLAGAGYVDVVVADGLAPGEHTCAIYVDSPDPNQFFSIAGFKTAAEGYPSLGLRHDRAWIVGTSLPQNGLGLTLKNHSDHLAREVSIVFPAGLKDGDGNPLSTLEAETLAPESLISAIVQPAFTGAEQSGEFVRTPTLSAQYPDPDGLIVHSTSSDAAVDATPSFVSVPTTFNPADKGANQTLSDDLLTITANNAAGGHQVARTRFSADSGKYYFQVATNVGFDASNRTGIGICQSDATGADLRAWGVKALMAHSFSAMISRNGATFVGSIGTGGHLDSRLIEVCLDFDAKLFWGRIRPVGGGSPGNWNGSGGNDPATGVGGISFSALTMPLHVCVLTENGDTDDVLTFNFGEIAWASGTSPPAGFGVFGPRTAVGSSVMMHGASWFVDTLTSTGEARAYNNVRGSGGTQNRLDVEFEGDALAITVQTNFGYGDLGVYAEDNTTLLHTISCHADSQQLVTTPLTGFGEGGHLVTLRKTTEDGKWIVFVKGSWSGIETFTEVEETVDLVFDARQPLPMPVQSVAISETGAVTYAAADPAAGEVTDTTVRTNADVASTEVLKRFPTYSVCYQRGHAEALGQYDIVICDPFAARAEDVLEWQAKGIKVFGYVSFGEEVGVYSERYNFASPVAPWRGDESGPGGFASYYNKAGFKSRECSECVNDNQALLGQKSCALARANYFLDPGRCSNICMNDSREGYSTFVAGGACGGGHTKDDFWSRTSVRACANGACPDYSPVHKSETGSPCPSYEQATGGFLQDFSVATPDFPDENGIWNSFYANPIEGAGWLERIESFYMPVVLGGPEAVENETVTLRTETVAGAARLVFDTAKSPIDTDAAIVLTTADGETSYQPYRDFTFDSKTGAVVMATTATPAVMAGQELLISYTRKGHRMDGVFMDTVDTVDVYPDAQFVDAMATLINRCKENHPAAGFISNRGFTILSKIIKSCSGVMFESWLTSWNPSTGEYARIVGEAEIAWNTTINDLLFELRATDEFDVFSLNYCHADGRGDALRQYCREQDAARGYLSWQATIDLGTPASNRAVETPQQPIKSNKFKPVT